MLDRPIPKEYTIKSTDYGMIFMTTSTAGAAIRAKELLESFGIYSFCDTVDPHVCLVYDTYDIDEVVAYIKQEMEK